MPSSYQGNAANASNSLSATITGIGAGPNSIVTTSGAHGFNTGDIVYISGVVGTGTFATWVNNSAPYGWVITVTDSTHFSIPNGTTSGAYASGGTAVDISLTPATTLPSNGDSKTVASVNVAFQTALDRTQFLAEQIANIKALLPVTEAFTFTAALSTSTVLAVTNNGPPCELQTSAPHGLKTGMWVTVSGATGDTAINGNWEVVVIDSTHFVLLGATGSGSYSASSATVTPVVPPNVTWMLVDGWGGGGGGEGGGGGNLLVDGSGAYNGSPVQGGAGEGAPRTTVLLPVVPLAALSVVIGIGGTGGSPGTAALSWTPASAGTNGAATVVTAGSAVATCIAGLGAGAGQAYATTVPTGDAVVAFGASARGNAQQNRPWPTVVAWQSTTTQTNIGNFIQQDAGAGGAAVLPFVAWTLGVTGPSTRGVGQFGDPSGGALPGAAGTNHGSSPTLLGGCGGGGGGSGPNGGAGGVGGDGSNAASASTSAGAAGFQGGPGGIQNNAANTANSGAGGGGGGTAGAATLPANTGLGGAGGGGDSGQVTLGFIQAGL